MEETKKKGSNLGADATLLTFSKVATSAIAMVMTMLLSRFRTKAEYGTYSQILMVVNLVTSILMLGLPKSLNYFLARTDKKEEKQQFLSLYYTLNTILSFIVGLALVLSVGLIEIYFNNPAIRSFLYFLALFPWTKIVCASIENLLIVYKKHKLLVGFRIINSLALLLTVMSVQWLGLTFKDYMILYVIVESLFAVSVYAIAGYVSGGIRPYINKNLLKTVLAFSIPLGLASVVGTLNIELDKLIIGLFMNKVEFAEYTNAARELPVTMVASTFTAVLMPQMVKMLKKEDNLGAIRLWKNATTLTMIIISIIGVGCYVYAEDVIMILYGSKYVTLGTVWVFRLYSLHLLMRCTYYGMVLNSIGKTGFIFWCSIIALASNAVLNLVMFNIFKLFGQSMIAPAVATLISTTAMAILQLAVTAKSLNVKFSQVFPWKDSGVILLVNIAFGVVFWFIKRLSPLDTVLSSVRIADLDGSALESLLLACVWAAAYFAVMLKPIKKRWKNLKVKD